MVLRTCNRQGKGAEQAGLLSVSGHGQDSRSTATDIEAANSPGCRQQQRAAGHQKRPKVNGWQVSQSAKWKRGGEEEREEKEAPRAARNVPRWRCWVLFAPPRLGEQHRQKCVQPSPQRPPAGVLQWCDVACTIPYRWAGCYLYGVAQRSSCRALTGLAFWWRGCTSTLSLSLSCGQFAEARLGTDG